MPSIQQLEADLHAFTDALTASKVLRYGIVYIETEERFRHLLAVELGLSMHVLYTYAEKTRKYWPHTRPQEGRFKEIWSDLEDALLMDLYQVTPFGHICFMLQNRTPLAIRRRASFLGVTR